MLIDSKYSVIVPVYNSENTLEELIERIDLTMQPYGLYEILCIDDFSTDNSWEVLQTIQKKNKNLRIIKFTKNFGQAAATLCGIRKASADTLIIIDDDLQFPPEEINKLITCFQPKEKYILFGVPRISKKSKLQKLSSYFIDRFLNKIVLKTKKKIRFSTFRILKKQQIDKNIYSEQTLKSAQVFFTMVSPDLMGTTEVEHHKRKKGKSNYSFYKKTQIALELLLVTTQLPLYLFLSCAFVSVPILLLLILIRISSINIHVSGLTLLICIIISFLFMVMGFLFLFVYLRKIFMDSLGADAYAIWDER